MALRSMLVYLSCLVFIMITWMTSSITASLNVLQSYGFSPEILQNHVSGDKFHCYTTPDTWIPITALNNDVCDCPDGSDEPATGACYPMLSQRGWTMEFNPFRITSSTTPLAQFGLDVAPLGFVCAMNEDYQQQQTTTTNNDNIINNNNNNNRNNKKQQSPPPKITEQAISIVRVNDGVCDCCDGSDEWDTDREICQDNCIQDPLKRRTQIDGLLETVFIHTNRRVTEWSTSLYQQVIARQISDFHSGRFSPSHLKTDPVEVLQRRFESTILSHIEERQQWYDNGLFRGLYARSSFIARAPALPAGVIPTACSYHSTTSGDMTFEICPSGLVLQYLSIAPGMTPRSFGRLSHISIPELENVTLSHILSSNDNGNMFYSTLLQNRLAAAAAAQAAAEAAAETTEEVVPIDGEKFAADIAAVHEQPSIQTSAPRSQFMMPTQEFIDLQQSAISPPINFHFTGGDRCMSGAYRSATITLFCGYPAQPARKPFEHFFQVLNFSLDYSQDDTGCHSSGVMISSLVCQTRDTDITFTHVNNTKLFSHLIAQNPRFHHDMQRLWNNVNTTLTQQTIDIQKQIEDQREALHQYVQAHFPDSDVESVNALVEQYIVRYFTYPTLFPLPSVLAQMETAYMDEKNTFETFLTQHLITRAEEDRIALELQKQKDAVKNEQLQLEMQNRARLAAAEQRRQRKKQEKEHEEWLKRPKPKPFNVPVDVTGMTPEEAEAAIAAAHIKAESEYTAKMKDEL